jgi:glycosyltransferase involved in cell wall biosynthesis
MPSLGVVVPAYNAAPWIDETLGTVLDQTRPPDEVIVVDDGSTDNTAQRAARLGVQVERQSNAGPPAAYNRGFELVGSEYVAMCPADDLWHPRKLEWQVAMLEAHPQVDVLFGRARFFGDVEGDYPRPTDPGLQDPRTFVRELYATDVVPAPTAVVRRELHRRLGRFDESLPSEDYEFWLRALRAGATFYYDNRLMVQLRQHGGNVSLKGLEIWEMNHRLRREYARDVGDPVLSRRLLSHDLVQIARCRFGAGRPDGAHAAYAASLRERPTLEAAVGAAALSVRPVGRALARINRLRRRGFT